MSMANAATDDGHVPLDTDRTVGRSKRFGDQRELIRRKHDSIPTEQACLQWAKRFILFHGKHHPNETGGAEIVAFLSHLAVQRNVAAATQNQAINASRGPDRRSRRGLPALRGVKKLSGRNAWRIRLGDYRILYEIHDERLLILVVDVGHRREIGPARDPEASIVWHTPRLADFPVGRMPDRAIRHSAADRDAGVSRQMPEWSAGVVARGKWPNRYRVPPYAGYTLPVVM